jgi:branched-chain amino acid transport system substrate-binding protein
MQRKFFVSQAAFSFLLLLGSVLLLSACTPTQGPFKGWNFGGTQTSQTHPTKNTQQQPNSHPPQASTQNIPVRFGQVTPQKVALLVPMTGRGKELGQSMLNAAQLALFDLKASQDFELLPQDTAGTPEIARATAQTSIDQGASLILGPVFAPDVTAVTQLAQSRNVQVLSFSTDMSVASPSSFVMGFLPQTQIQRVIDFAAAEGQQRIALIAPNDAYGNLVAQEFDRIVRQRNLMIANVVRYTGSTPTLDHLRPLIQKTDSSNDVGFDAVLIATNATQANQISLNLTQLGAPPTKVRRLGTGLWDQTEATKLAGLQGAVFAASSPSLRASFEQRYQQAYGTKPQRLATLAYDATALAIILQRQGQGYSRQAILNPNGFSGIDGPFRFRGDGVIERSLAIMEIQNNAVRTIQESARSFQQGL